LAFPEAETTLVHPGKYANALFTARTREQLEEFTGVLVSVAGKTFPNWVVTSDLKDRLPGEYRYYYRQAPEGSPAIQITANRDDQGRYYGYISFNITDNGPRYSLLKTDLTAAARPALERRLAEAMRQMVEHSRNGFADIRGAPYADER